MWISLMLFLEVVIKRNYNSWDVHTFKSTVWNAINSMRQCLKANSAEFCNGKTPWEHNVSLFFLGKIELKFADRNQFSIDFKRSVGQKITLATCSHIPRAIDWVIPSSLTFSGLPGLSVRTDLRNWNGSHRNNNSSNKKCYECTFHILCISFLCSSNSNNSKPEVQERQKQLREQQ